MYTLRKLLLTMSLLFSTSISFFFESCLLCSCLRWTLFGLILLPVRFDRFSFFVEIFGLVLSLFLTVLQNPLFCESSCNTLLSFLPLSSLMVFFLLLILRLAKNKKETLAPIKKEVRSGEEKNRSLGDRD